MRKCCKPLPETHPELCKLWHPTKNIITTQDVHRTSKVKVWWFCSVANDHEWQSRVCDMTIRQQCPCCSGQKVVPSTSLAIKMPEIASQWHQTLNKFTPSEVTVSSAKKAWWQCANYSQHVWEARVFSRTKQDAGCPFCYGKKTDSTNSFASIMPDIACEWHPTLNGELKPEHVVAGSAKKVWWKCSVVASHIWKASIIHRYNGRRDGSGTGCPYCSGQKVDGLNSLAAKFPEIAAQWHPTKNGNLTPDNVVPTSHKRIWWKCSKADDHEWESTVSNRINNECGCPCCCGRKVVRSNCLVTTHPKIAEEWHPTLNVLTPNDVTYACNSSFWWRCINNPKHEWKARIDARVRATGCPFCASSKGETAIREVLDSEGICYISQYRFPDCKNKRCLPFDFAIMNAKNMLGVIEFNGSQHYVPNAYFGGQKGHEMTAKNDAIKQDYCLKNNIPLLRLPFWEENIKGKLLKWLKHTI